MKKILIIICLISFSVICFGYAEVEQTSENIGSPFIKRFITTQDAQWLCEVFMMKLIEDEVSGAFGLLKPYSSVPEAEFMNFQAQTMKLIESIKPDFGKMLGYTLIREEVVGNTMLKFTYLQKFEKHAFRWMFYFYKPEDEWLFNEFSVDNKLRELFGD